MLNHKTGLGIFIVVLAAGCADGSDDIGFGGSGGASIASTSTTSAMSSSTVSASTASVASSTASSGGAGGSPGLPLGSDCSADAQCASDLCKEVLINSGQAVCVTPCTQQDDCGVGTSFFCDPLSAGSPDGYCVPHSPAHCLSCTTNADCGSLSEECLTAPGDNAKACHVDCAIGGEDACPPEYTCTALTVNGSPRSLCRPNVATCLDAIGGFCDRVTIPQPCTRDNSVGTCTGQRQCIPGSKRFDICGAAAPQCKADCSLQDPAGCVVDYCAQATSVPNHCGSCMNVCPGFMQQADVVTCLGGSTCTFECQGENYDVNNSAGDGCEAVDSPLGNHVQASAAYLGSFPCDDGGSSQNVNGKIFSDGRTHNPSISGFNAATGAAPDFFYLFADGGSFCQNDLNVSLQITGSGNPSCYKLSAITSDGTYTCQANASGTCSISNGSGSYSDDTNIYFKLEKTCGTNVKEAATYKVTGHL